MIVTTDDIIVDYIHKFPKVPQHTMGGLIRYWKDRCPCGSFLTAMLENNLMEACGQADEQNQVAIFEICTFIYNEIPFLCYGSPEKIEAWLDCAG